MHNNRKYHLHKSNMLLPVVTYKKSAAVICSHCHYINDIENFFCTNCGYPLQNMLQVDSFQKKLQANNDFLSKAQNAVFTARMVLYVMAFCLLPGILFVFSPLHIKYIIAVIAFILSCIFFFLAVWSRRNPFPAMFTSFIILITFSAINIFNKLAVIFTTLHGLISMLLCLALLFIIMKGMQGAYRLNLLKQEV